MTAIALLNPENDPHLVADTLLTVTGEDPNPSAHIWLPALGSIRSEWIIEGEPGYIARLGRKTFILPNASGVLAFAGDCLTAFKFWSELSAKFINVTAFEPLKKIDAPMVRDTLGQLGAQDISLLGVLVNNQGQCEAFIHNPKLTLPTRNLGTCYVAGSGTKLLEKIIEEHDRQVGPPPKAGVVRRMGPTEDLAERISSQMLYVESCQTNGSAGSSIASGCGGFYEWYQVSQTGVRPLRPRLDIHFEENDGHLWITRAYFCEQTQLKSPPVGLVPSQKYPLRVLNLGLEPIELLRTSADWWEFNPADCFGVAIESTFELYDNPGSTARKEGPVSEELLMALFGTPIDILRIRFVCTHSGQAILRSASRKAEEKEILAKIMLRDSHVCIQLHNAVVAKAIDCLKRIPVAIA